MIIPYFTDNHISGTNSENRVGNYLEDSLTKLEEILQVAKENKSPFILCGGDLLDSPIISLTICDKILDLIEEYDIPIYTLIGNHPMVNHNWEVSQATTMAHMFRRSEVIRQLDTLEYPGLLIQGIDYEKDIETKLKLDGLRVDSKEERWSIAVVHALIMPKPFLPTVNHITVQELECNYDIVLCAHYHQPFHKIIDEIHYVNPGCIGRTSIDEADIAPSIILLDTEKRTNRRIILKSAKPKEEVFDLSKVAIKKEFNNEIEKFIESLQTTQFSDLDLIGIAKEICRKSEVSEEIAKIIIDRITKS